jgi:AraC-like DNA-binding protein
MNLQSLPIESHGTTHQVDRWKIESQCQPVARRSPQHDRVDVYNLPRYASQATTRQGMTNVFGEHLLEASDSNSSAPVAIQHLSTGNFQLVDLQWQEGFQLTHSTPADRYLLYIVYSGYLTHKIAAQQTCWCAPDTATMINPGQKVEIASSQQGKALAIAIDRDSIVNAVSKLLAGGAVPKGSGLKQPVIFTSSIDLTSELGLSLKQFLQFLWDSTHSAPTASAPLIVQKLEQAFLDCAIEGLPNNYTEELLDRADGALAAHVRKARAFIESNLREDIKLADIAAAASVCARLLQKAFAHHCGCSPMRFVTKSRLQRIRQELEAAQKEQQAATAELKVAAANLKSIRAGYQSALARSQRYQSAATLGAISTNQLEEAKLAAEQQSQSIAANDSRAKPAK